ncbi:hypothetical protein EVAR_64299_1 [Eumeta japonica]|uniref:Uncharacterized protein n=1 Tax=Eumeta variegata TaxID=151549 RepID=A0A4C1ZSS1_EUMVA|nr:hypothetical protein EVAR_64299_1 [Eumeta japonica]
MISFVQFVQRAAGGAEVCRDDCIEPEWLFKRLLMWSEMRDSYYSALAFGLSKDGFGLSNNKFDVETVDEQQHGILTFYLTQILSWNGYFGNSNCHHFNKCFNDTTQRTLELSLIFIL